MIEYIFIGVFVGIFLLLILTYFINSKKINKNNKKPEKKDVKTIEKTKKDDKKTDAEKVEVPSELSKEKPIDKAIDEANYEYHMKEAFEKIEQEKNDFEKSSKIEIGGSRLKLERGDFKTELQKSLETNTISSQTNIISSATAKMDYEISSEKKEDKIDIDKQIAEEYEKEHAKNQKSLANEINNLSTEAKVILINDVLKKKY